MSKMAALYHNEIISDRTLAKVLIDAMIIANHRTKKLGDLFSIRNVESKPGLFCGYHHH